MNVVQLTPTPKKWTEAQTTCESQAGSLMTLHNKETNDFLFQSLLQNKNTVDSTEIWIGLQETLVGENAEYVWVDGTAFDFQAWADDQPNSFTLVEICGAALNTSQSWKVSSCFEKKPYVCQLKKGGLYVTLSGDEESTRGATTVRTSDVPICRERTKADRGEDLYPDKVGNGLNPDKVGNGLNPDKVGNGLLRESNAKNAPSTSGNSGCEDKLLSRGGLVGVVVSSLCACAVLVAAAFIVGKKKGALSWQHASSRGDAGSSNSSGFDNALYTASHRDSEMSNMKTSLDELSNM
ncbi:lectin [Elysia marginata]|uniref:Lectin n=1 Tax=Elysia marginata TaxID=1093978 RepID=A0AAV4JR32_9GAST|nr:lectin [Elysia marginata]